MFNIGTILQAIFLGVATLEGDITLLEQGQPVVTPSLQAGSAGGKPIFIGLYAATQRNVTISNG